MHMRGVLFLWVVCALPGAGPVVGAEASATTKTATAATAPEEQAPAPLPDFRIEAETDLDRLGEALAGERRSLEANGYGFEVFRRPLSGGPPKGALVLIPGEGSHPTASTALAVLREEMPAFGWTVWLTSLENPPLDRVAAQPRPTPPPAEDAAPAAAAKAATAPAPPGATTADAPAPPAVPVFPAAADISAVAERQHEEAMRSWSERSRARIAATVAAAAAEGPVVLVAEGAAAPLLLGYAAEAPASARAAVLIEPLDLPGLPGSWPQGYATPVLEVLGPASRRETGALRRERASASRLHYYRQALVTVDASDLEASESLLTRRLRGWLSSLDLDPPQRAAD